MGLQQQKTGTGFVCCATLFQRGDVLRLGAWNEDGRDLNHPGHPLLNHLEQQRPEFP
jgi:hypothetical protein